MKGFVTARVSGRNARSMSESRPISLVPVTFAQVGEDGVAGIEIASVPGHDDGQAHSPGCQVGGLVQRVLMVCYQKYFFCYEASPYLHPSK